MKGCLRGRFFATCRLVAVRGLGDDPPLPIRGARWVVQPSKEPLLVLALPVVRGRLL